MIGIYKITNTVNNKCYIGQSKNLMTRIRKHIKTLINGTNRNEHLQNAYNTYGTGNFTIEIIEECLTEELDEREIYWIDFYRSYDREYGYNKTRGGIGGNSYYELMDDDNKEIINQKRKNSKPSNKNTYCYTNGVVIKYITEQDVKQYEADGWHRGVPEYVRIRERLANLGEKNGFYGKKHSEESKVKMSESRKGSQNWNYGKLIYHKDNEQKYIAQEDIPYYKSLGWTQGMTEEVRNKISESNKGKRRSQDMLRKKSIIYIYNGQEYIGWRKLRAYLIENGYPKISEAAITKLSKGLHVRGMMTYLKKSL